jgi:hypothetical protein
MIVKSLAAGFILLSTASMAYADSTVGEVVAYDRKAQRIVLDDKTIWTLEGSEAVVPPDLKAGDRIEIDFESAGDNGISKVEAVRPAPPK